MMSVLFAVSFFFFNDTATTEIYTLSLHDLFRSLAVALLADRMAGGDAVKHAWPRDERDRKSTRLNSSHLGISYAVFCLTQKNNNKTVNHLTEKKKKIKLKNENKDKQ